MKAHYKKHILQFKRPSGTSRGILTEKETWLLILEDQGKFGIGECGLLRGLSIDDRPDYEEKLKWICDQIALGNINLRGQLQEFPSIQFGLEQALLSLRAEDPFLPFPSDFTAAKANIPINGLVWMGDEAFMREQIAEKLAAGFHCVKMKIGAIDFNQELDLIASIRKTYSADMIELRVDANGAFPAEEALEKLERLAAYDIHSIEQPIKPGMREEMASLCLETPIPIALDEELIGIFDVTEKEELLQTLKPQYIILKPSLIGGFEGCREWIILAEKYAAGWWVTSALESNIGLNAIAQWTFTLNSRMPQGLGTGGLYENNFDSPLTVIEGTLKYDTNKMWKANLIEELCI
ncbi:o-succinylbenzoate synthase [Poritiphilus flavus]|uniref:O-succinylbenzoate synthase n=1 Tax=Poritiphilus flavus TaxID=2697053 RepID=A0A6L9EFT4_9FLAO|nr:o-succinylbenzoate synthase [Poritiphilus flavus]NAS13452.1 o-succinylbenzoate synthase [Poritiphilus flavus]